METANRPYNAVFADLTGMSVAEFVKDCQENNVDPIAEMESAIRSLAAENSWDMDANELDEQIRQAQYEICKAIT